MAGDLRGFALHKAELLSGRLREMLSSGQGYLRARFGVDLGLEPELYPTWLVLSAAAGALLLPLLLAVSWAAVCGGGLRAGKRRRSPAGRDVRCGDDEETPAKATVVGGAKSVKAEEQQQQQQLKKRSKKKAADKVTQPNGQPVSVAQEEVVQAPPKVVDSKPPQQITPEQVQEVQAPVLVKKAKNKPKADQVKPVQFIITDDGKEPDEGAWETKVSNREKKKQQQRRKEKEESGSCGWVEAPRTNAEAPAGPVTGTTKRSRNHESLSSRTTEKGGATSGRAASGWREELSVHNGGGWADGSAKMSGQFGDADGNKWSSIHTAVHYRAPAKHQPWAQERQAWSGTDGQIKTEQNSVPLSMLRRNPAEPAPNSAELHWVGGQAGVDDEWSALNGIGVADPSSDWNAPAEHWGNYEEVAAAPRPPAGKEQSGDNKASDDEKDVDDPSAAAKSKKRRKKKKKAEEEEGGAESESMNASPQELPAPPSKKHQSSVTPSSSQKKPEPLAEPPKASQKKKARRET